MAWHWHCVSALKANSCAWVCVGLLSFCCLCVAFFFSQCPLFPRLAVLFSCTWLHFSGQSCFIRELCLALGDSVVATLSCCCGVFLVCHTLSLSVLCYPLSNMATLSCHLLSLEFTLQINSDISQSQIQFRLMTYRFPPSYMILFLGMPDLLQLPMLSLPAHLMCHSAQRADFS